MHDLNYEPTQRANYFREQLSRLFWFLGVHEPNPSNYEDTIAIKWGLNEILDNESPKVNVFVLLRYELH